MGAGHGAPAHALEERWRADDDGREEHREPDDLGEDGRVVKVLEGGAVRLARRGGPGRVVVAVTGEAQLHRGDGGGGERDEAAHQQAPQDAPDRRPRGGGGVLGGGDGGNGGRRGKDAHNDAREEEEDHRGVRVDGVVAVALGARGAVADGSHDAEADAGDDADTQEHLVRLTLAAPLGRVGDALAVHVDNVEHDVDNADHVRAVADNEAAQVVSCLQAYGDETRNKESARVSDIHMPV